MPQVSVRALDRASLPGRDYFTHVLSTYYVNLLPDGRWEVRAEGGASAAYARKEEAIAAATEMARAAAPGMVRIYDDDGRVETRMLGERTQRTTHG